MAFRTCVLLVATLAVIIVANASTDNDDWDETQSTVESLAEKVDCSKFRAACVRKAISSTEDSDFLDLNDDALKLVQVELQQSERRSVSRRLLGSAHARRRFSGASHAKNKKHSDPQMTSAQAVSLLKKYIAEEKSSEKAAEKAAQMAQEMLERYRALIASEHAKDELKVDNFRKQHDQFLKAREEAASGTPVTKSKPDSKSSPVNDLRENIRKITGLKEHKDLLDALMTHKKHPASKDALHGVRGKVAALAKLIREREQGSDSNAGSAHTFAEMREHDSHNSFKNSLSRMSLEQLENVLHRANAKTNAMSTALSTMNKQLVELKQSVNQCVASESEGKCD